MVLWSVAGLQRAKSLSQLMIREKIYFNVFNLLKIISAADYLCQYFLKIIYNAPVFDLQIWESVYEFPSHDLNLSLLLEIPRFPRLQPPPHPMDR